MAQPTTTATFTIQPPEPFDFTKPQEWERWIRRFDRFRLASNLNATSEENQVNTLVYCMGDEAEDVLKGLTLTEDQRKKYTDVEAGFDAFFVPKKNVIYERAKFNQRVQLLGETVDSFIIALYGLAEHCNYGELQKELIRGRLVVGLRNVSLSEKLQLDKDLTLETAITKTRQFEEVRRQQCDLRGENGGASKCSNVDAVHAENDKKPKFPSKPRPKAQTPGKYKPNTRFQQSSKACYRCGKMPPHGKSECPAADAVCHNCGKMGHFSKVCRNAAKSLNAVTTEDEESLFLGAVDAGKDPWTVQLQPEAVPFSLHAPRRVPLPLMGKVKEEIDRMERMGVITKIEEPTDWCAGMVVVPKKGGTVRICVDFTKMNESVCREKFILPSVEHSLGMLAGATVFSKLDANMGFWQVPLTKESAKYTTFITPFERYYFNRLPFGIASAPEHFQRMMMTEVTGGLEGALCHMDDILVWGQTQDEHDRRLHKVLEKAQKAGITLNMDKCELTRHTVKFLGHVISADGVKPDPEKTRAVQEMDPPKNVSELRSFLGMVNQLGRFLPNLAEKDKVLRDLLSKKNHWYWGTEQQAAFDHLKTELSSTPVLALYNPNSALKI
nr:uncharacterized protein LOC129450004 [Misgurnus anguillicaudatus]